MAGHQLVAAQFAHLLHQDFEFDEAIAANAGIGGSTSRIFVDKVVDHRRPELLLEVHHVVRNVEDTCDASGVFDGAHRATACVPRVCLAFLPNLHCQADNVVAAALHESRGYAAVHPAAHGNEDGFTPASHSCKTSDTLAVPSRSTVRSSCTGGHL